MNLWLIAAGVMLMSLIPCGVVVFRGGFADRVVGLELAGVLVTLELVLLAQGFNRTSFLDLPLTLAMLSLGGGMVFVRFLQRWL